MPVTKRDELLATCTLAPLAADGACAWCAAELPAGRRSWCSDQCGELFWMNHWWSVARTAAKRRDRYRCRRCGARGPKRPSANAHATRKSYLAALRAWRDEKKVARLEVNHIDPAAGRHGQLSCVHHLENLETLCLGCHKLHTKELRERRAADAADAPAAGVRTVPQAVRPAAGSTQVPYVLSAVSPKRRRATVRR